MACVQDEPWSVDLETTATIRHGCCQRFARQRTHKDPGRATKILFAADSSLRYRLRFMNEKPKVTTKPDMETIAIVRS